MNSTEVEKAIDNAAARGMTFHIFCDMPYYVDGKHVGKHQYHASFASYNVAKAVAKKETNATVYNSSYEVV